eukprot:1145475-Pelagomonas_calceolata.AAC.1
MYVCNICQRTYHWKCLTSLGCYTDEQGHLWFTAVNWACPACASLNNEDKLNNEAGSREGLVKANWTGDGSWEPEEAKTNLPTFPPAHVRISNPAKQTQSPSTHSEPGTLQPRKTRIYRAQATPGNKN